MLIQDIADRQNIPLKYLQKILFDLKQAGILNSRKGPGGGYILARSPERITLGQVLDSMDGGVAEFCGDALGALDCDCPHPDACAIRNALSEIAVSMRRQLENVTFADMCERQRALTGETISDFVI
jgi:Rrf2 family protein